MQQKERSALHLAARTAAVGRGVCVMVSLSGCSRDSPSGAEPPLIEAEGVEIPEEKERGEGREDRYSGEVKMLWLSGDQAPGIDDQPHGGSRSEEHTSELQSLMRISYAVFCLKKKTENQEQKNTS